MAKTAMIRSRMEPKLKHEALHNGLPFELRIPTNETLEAVRQVRSGKGISTFSSVEEMRADLLKDA